MAQMNSLRKLNTTETPTTPRARTSPTFEQLLQGDAPNWVSSSSPVLGRDHDHGENYGHNNKKSVLTKVKEKAKKMRQSLSKKKHGHEDTESPPWGVTLDDDEEDEDPEYLGAPMYESEKAPEACKETARQHPRAIPVVSEKHVLPNSIKHDVEQEKQKPLSPSKTITETVTEKLGPAYTAVSDATHAIASKIAGLTIAGGDSGNFAGSTDTAGVHSASPLTVVTDTADCDVSGMHKLGRGSEPRGQTWDKGVSVKEYLMTKLEPGEDERVLSQVITEAISPKRTPGDVGVVEKVKEAVTSLLRNEEPSQSTTTTATNLSTSPIPISTIPQQGIEEENHGRILQEN
ncbi:hypothetical protein Acr_15g0000440 [Actinidia rufa]|uniref:Low-temperature-induced protein n=1 Tax=Actinidia rufa TaxID=165716 RepID=A0A7J0FRY2_9ERIC|nr:hypothetical protein Acr_15g0000440 [Actinidia rufa]